jgi:hypothetical protein
MSTAGAEDQSMFNLSAFHKFKTDLLLTEMISYDNSTYQKYWRLPERIWIHLYRVYSNQVIYKWTTHLRKKCSKLSPIVHTREGDHLCINSPMSFSRTGDARVLLPTAYLKSDEVLSCKLNPSWSAFTIGSFVFCPQKMSPVGELIFFSYRWKFYSFLSWPFIWKRMILEFFSDHSCSVCYGE